MTASVAPIKSARRRRAKALPDAAVWEIDEPSDAQSIARALHTVAPIASRNDPDRSPSIYRQLGCIRVRHDARELTIEATDGFRAARIVRPSVDGLARVDALLPAGLVRHIPRAARALSSLSIQFAGQGGTAMVVTSTGATFGRPVPARSEHAGPMALPSGFPDLDHAFAPFVAEWDAATPDDDEPQGFNASYMADAARMVAEFNAHATCRVRKLGGMRPARIDAASDYETATLTIVLMPVRIPPDRGAS